MESMIQYFLLHILFYFRHKINDYLLLCLKKEGFYMSQAEQLSAFQKQLQYVTESEVDAKILLGNLMNLKIDTLASLSYLQLMQNLSTLLENPLYYELENIDEHTFKILASLKQIISQLAPYLQGSSEEKHSLIKTLQMTQESLLHKFDVLYSYANELLIYANILERKYRIAEVADYEGEDDLDYQRFYDDIRQFIFHSDYLGSIDEKMKVLIEKLPLSMTKDHYFDALNKTLTSLFKQGSENNVIDYINLLKNQVDASNLPGHGKEFQVLYGEIVKMKDYVEQELSINQMVQASSLGESLGLQLKDILSIISLGYELVNRLIILFSIQGFTMDSLYSIDKDLKKLHSSVSNYVNDDLLSLEYEEATENSIELLQVKIAQNIEFYKEVQKEVHKMLDLFDSKGFDYDHHLQHLFSFENTLFTYINLEIYDRYNYVPDTSDILDKKILQKHLEEFKKYVLTSIKKYSSSIQKEKMKSILKLVPPIFFSEPSFMEYFTSTLELSVSTSHKLAFVNEIILVMDQYGYFTAHEYPHHSHDEEHHHCNHDHH